MEDLPELRIPINGGYIKESELLRFVVFDEMRICAECYKPYGFWYYHPAILDQLPEKWYADKRYYQKCHRQCREYNSRPGLPHGDQEQSPWPEFDFNERITLCYACGQEIRLSGSKLSTWFCKTCQGRAIYYNSQHNPFIVPEGRHSSMAGYQLSGKDARDEEKLREFTGKVNRLNRSIAWLEVWRRFVMATNFKILGFSGDVRLNEYLAVAYSDRYKFETWGELCNYMMKKYQEDETI